MKELFKKSINFLTILAEHPYDESWHRKWFPHGPGEQDSNQAVSESKNLYDAHHGIAMGVVDSSCDDGKVCQQSPFNG